MVSRPWALRTPMSRRVLSIQSGIQSAFFCEAESESEHGILSQLYSCWCKGYGDGHSRHEAIRHKNLRMHSLQSRFESEVKSNWGPPFLAAVSSFDLWYSYQSILHFNIIGHIRPSSLRDDLLLMQKRISVCGASLHHVNSRSPGTTEVSVLRWTYKPRL
ncbi:hypothetical protein IW261DRAFT_158775 [Armillaria novae-zelandiae]|uniref:Uncharacterized protein n=1 Tax=Armillaria novae-zelandiae TaxID=153914 RepID=A0AA39NCU9_9AGAR|nr:hypothetical protein IW261DRAFT_158775 [Armillaria novae-zelandiae]